MRNIIIQLFQLEAITFNIIDHHYLYLYYQLLKYLKKYFYLKFLFFILFNIPVKKHLLIERFI